MSQLLWTPSQQRIDDALLTKFIARVGAAHGLHFADYDAVWRWSVEDPDAFWASVWEFCDVQGERSGLVFQRAAHQIDCAFFPQAKLNYAENLLHAAGAEPDIIFHSETGHRRCMSLAELKAAVSRLQQALSELGLQQGDRVAGYLPNIPESVVAMLAVTSLGAVWSSCSPDFGLNGLQDRFGQIQPKLLFTADGYSYNGKTFDSLTTVRQLAEQTSSIEKIIVIPYLNDKPDIEPLGSKAVLLDSLCAGYQAEALRFTRVGFREPLFILFSSGTTGLPKCFVHSVGGTLLHHLREHQLQFDVQAGDRMLFFTTLGWAMWNWLVSGLASGASIVIYEGSPTYPDSNALADIIAAEKLTHFGTSAKYLDSCAKQGLRPIDSHDFSSLRTIMSTGSPLSADGFRYVYEAWKKDVCLASISGGTDVIGCFVGGNPIGPVYAGQCQKRHLGINVCVFDDDGQSVVGQRGELVSLLPHPAMPLGFLNDPQQARYRDAYFSRFDNVWCQGDFVELTPEGGMIFYGRSDATLNPGGVRIGTAEIYRQVEEIDEVLEALVIGQDWDGDVRVVLFVRLREGVVLDDQLVQRIKSQIRNNATPRHVPAKIIAVADIPRTHSGKITELAVRDVVHGRKVKNVEALANPQALELFKDLPELAS